MPTCTRLLEACLMARLSVADVALPVFAVILAASPVAAQVNGGFESPVVTPGSYQAFGTGSTFSGWTVVGAPGNVAIVSSTFSCCGFGAFNPHSGAQFLDLTGETNTATGVQQSMATNAGGQYSLSFWIGNIVDPRSLLGHTSTVKVTVDGASAIFTNALGAGQNTIVWSQYFLNFAATSTSTVIAFENADPSWDNHNGLDDVALTQTSTVTPEPGSMLLVATGILAVGIVRRRGRQR